MAKLDDPGTRTVQALRVSCPKCGAKPGDPCTYDRPSLFAPGPGSSSAHERVHVSKYVREQVMLMGKPCVRPHNERFNKVPHRMSESKLRRYRARVQANREDQERRDVLVQRKAAQTREAWVQAKAFERWRMLMTFFAEHGEIFKETR